MQKGSHRLEKLQDIYDRDSSAVTNSGIVLKGKKLFVYISKMQKRHSVVRCLAEKTVAQMSKVDT